MCQCTCTVSTHPPDGDPTHVSSNSTCEGEGIARTGEGSCSKLSINITWRKNKNTHHRWCMQIILQDLILYNYSNSSRLGSSQEFRLVHSTCTSDAPALESIVHQSWKCLHRYSVKGVSKFCFISKSVLQNSCVLYVMVSKKCPSCAVSKFKRAKSYACVDILTLCGCGLYRLLKRWCLCLET